MKIKISISMDKNTISKVESRIKDGVFRNKGHFIELATQRYLNEVENGKN